MLSVRSQGDKKALGGTKDRQGEEGSHEEKSRGREGMKGRWEEGREG